MCLERIFSGEFSGEFLFVVFQLKTASVVLCIGIALYFKALVANSNTISLHIYNVLLL